MAKKKFVVASFDDEKKLFSAVEEVRTAGYKIHDVYTPFPVHGLDEALGLRETSLHIAGFIYGITGTAVALGCMAWIYVSDWPQVYGGKPHFALPAFIPIIFELTVLFSAVGMVLTFCWLCQLAPFVRKHLFNLRQTDDLFIMAVDANVANTDEALKFVKNQSPVDVEIQEAETQWWWGRFDKERQLINEDAVRVL
jgi:hypothetical protein